MRTGVPRIAAKTVLDASRPNFAMHLPREAFEKLAEVARGSGDGLNDAASKIICQELGLPWSPAVKRLTVDELREANARRGRAYYWRHAEKLREKARARNRARAEEIGERKREKRRLERERHGPYSTDPKFAYPSEWSLLPREEQARRKTLIRQAAHYAMKRVLAYRDVLKEKANRVIMGAGGLFVESTVTKGRQACAYADRRRYRERLLELDRAIEAKVTRPSTPNEIMLMPDMATEKAFRHCSACRMFDRRTMICLRHGFGTDVRNWCPSFVSRGDINSETKRCRRKQEKPNRNRF